jgi:hypothetical protein
MDLKRILSLAAGSDDEAEDDRDAKRIPRGWDNNHIHSNTTFFTFLKNNWNTPFKCVCVLVLFFSEPKISNPNIMDVDERAEEPSKNGDGEVYQIAPRLIALLKTVIDKVSFLHLVSLFRIVTPHIAIYGFSYL